MLKEKIKGKIGRKALIINLGFEANVGPAGLCDRGAAAAAPTAPVRHGQTAVLVLHPLSQRGQV